MESADNAVHREPWNKGKIVGQKAPFKLKDIWALGVRLQMEGRVRELALFNLGIDSKLRGCDLVALKVRDVCHGDQVAARAIVMQHKHGAQVLGAPIGESTVRCLGIEVDDASRSPSRRRSEAASGGRPRLRAGVAALDGGFVVQGRIGGLGHIRTSACPIADAG